MKRIFLSTALTLTAVTPFVLLGADVPDDPNRLSLGARFGMNFKADFGNSAPYFNPVNPGPAVGGTGHIYDDGYVLVDSSGNRGGRTWNWGYDNVSQAPPNSAGDTMQFHAIQPRPAVDDVTDNPQYGIELTYQRILASLGSSGRWGLETGFSYTDLDLRSNRSGTAPVTTDSFALNGVLPPGAGYNGTFAGPGTLLGDTPTRTTGSAALTSRQSLSGQLFGIRLGPFAEWNFTPRLSLAVSLGFTLAPATVDYNFSETVSLAGGTAYTASGRSSETELLYGGYVSGVLRYDFNPRWGVYVGAQFQSLTDTEQSIGSRTARLDSSVTVFGVAGASWRF